MRPNFLTASAVARLAGRSRAGFHRDIAAGLIQPATQLPGTTGAYLFTEEEATRYAATVKGDA